MRPESVIQRAVIKRLAAKGYVAVSVPNGSWLAGDKLQRIKQMAAMKADGLLVGFPDLIVIGTNRIGFMEVKTDKGKVSPAQTMVRKILEDKGHNYAVVRSQDDAIEALSLWGWW